MRNDEGYWKQIKACISEHSEAEFTHGICPECAVKLFRGIDYEQYKEKLRYLRLGAGYAGRKEIMYI